MCMTISCLWPYPLPPLLLLRPLFSSIAQRLSELPIRLLIIIPLILPALDASLRFLLRLPIHLRPLVLRLLRSTSQGVRHWKAIYQWLLIRLHIITKRFNTL
jgi:hypothetical protein